MAEAGAGARGGCCGPGTQRWACSRWGGGGAGWGEAGAQPAPAVVLHREMSVHVALYTLENDWAVRMNDSMLLAG